MLYLLANSISFASVFVFKQNGPDLSLLILLLSQLLIASFCLFLLVSSEYTQVSVGIVSLAFALPGFNPCLSLFFVNVSAHL